MSTTPKPLNDGPGPVNPRRGRAVKAKGAPAAFVPGDASPPKRRKAAAAAAPTPPPPPPSAPSTPLDVDQVLEESGIWWENGSSRYYTRRQEDGREVFSILNAEQLTRKLKVRRFLRREGAGEAASQIDQILDRATETRVVKAAHPIAGRPAGIHWMGGSRILVTEGPRLVVPREGDFVAIISLLTNLLGNEGAMWKAAWHKCAYETFRLGEHRPGQAAILIGPADCGKSRIQHLTTALFGGRVADPTRYLLGLTTFNAELLSAEHAMMEEIPANVKAVDRDAFAQNIKTMVANDSQSLHPKNAPAVTVTPTWRLSISLNDQPHQLQCMPRMENDFTEKVIMLRASQASPDFWAQFRGDNDFENRRNFQNAMAAALPAYAAYLLRWEIPDNMRGQRYGVRSYVDPAAAELIFEHEREFTLLTIIDRWLFRPEAMAKIEDAKNGGDGRAWDCCLEPVDNGATPVGGVYKQEGWEGDATDLIHALTLAGSFVRSVADGLLKQSPGSCGRMLGTLSRRSPKRFVKDRTGDKRRCLIKPPE